jgi:Helix-turn-helix domain
MQEYAPDLEGGLFAYSRPRSQRTPARPPRRINEPDHLAALREHGAGAGRRGLRREELAQLAGVGVTWYTWLEQGRDINVSPQVLEAVCRTLLLDPHEHSHAMTLAGFAEQRLAKECQSISPATATMLDGLAPIPATV